MALTEEQRAKLNAKAAMKAAQRAEAEVVNDYNEPYEGEVTYKLEKAPYYADRILNIPSSTQITEEEIKYVADEIKKLLKELANG